MIRQRTAWRVSRALIATALSCGLAVPHAAAAQPNATATDSDALAHKLSTATAAVRANDPGARARLLEAIDSARAQPAVVARSTQLYEDWLTAMLALAEAHFRAGADERADEVLDRAVRVARGSRPPLDAFSHALADAYQARMRAAALRPVGAVHVACDAPCRVILDGRTAGTGTDTSLTGIPLGEHTVRIEALNRPNTTFEQSTFEIRAESPRVELRFARPLAPSSTAPLSLDDAGGRTIPRWASIVGMSLGALGMVAGGVLLGIDGTCPDGEDPRGERACANVLRTRPAGLALLAAGAGALIGFSAVLTVGELRSRRAATTAALAFSMRF